MNNLVFNNPAIGEIDLINDKSVRLDSITGVSAIAQINTQAVTGRDGSTVNSKNIPERQMIVKFHIIAGSDAEQAMHDMYSIFAVMSSGTMTFVGRLGASKIDYIVSSIEIPPNEQFLRGAVTLICPDPYFRALEQQTGIIAGSVSQFKFPYHFPNRPFYISKRIDSLFAQIINEGEAATGCDIIMRATAEVVNPAIINVTTGDESRLNFTMEGGDVIKISTEKDNKKILLTREGITTNIFNRIIYPFTFFWLEQGKNIFKYDAERGINNLDIDIQYSAKFAAMYTNAPGAIETRMPYDQIEDYIDRVARIVRRGGLDG